MIETIRDLFVIYILPVIFYMLAILRAKIMVWKGKGVAFHNIKFFNGNKITVKDYLQLSAACRTILLRSDEGLIVFNHGNEDGTMVNDQNPSFTVDSRYFSELVPDGEWYLISCYNGMRQDYMSDTHIFKRVCPTKYPLHAVLVGSTLYVCSSNEYICKVLGLPIPSDEDIKKSIARLPEKR